VGVRRQSLFCAARSNSRVWRGLLASGALLALAAPSRSARAEGPTSDVDLTWDAPTPSRPTRVAVLQRVSAELSKLPPDATRGLSVTAHVSRTARGTLRLVIQTESERGSVGERTFESAGCAELVDATVLVLGIAARTLAQDVPLPAELTPALPAAAAAAVSAARSRVPRHP
jgi:hypothetical protein